MPKLEPMQQPPSRTGGRRARAMRVSTSLAEINVVPLVDVMLVLLVIFMVAAPMMTAGLPGAAAAVAPSRRAISAPVTVTVPLSFRTRSAACGSANEAVALDVLAERIRQALSGQRQQNVDPRRRRRRHAAGTDARCSTS